MSAALLIAVTTAIILAPFAVSSPIWLNLMPPITVKGKADMAEYVLTASTPINSDKPDFVLV